ncbi:hypothetical protein ACGF7U_31485 [Micromonospora sp. NPDC047670]|uniref:hypothetical protein n=1 Tax=Micromonospora sp. NPDC047670 TaxID=3364252 RepID=UPI00371DD8FC
MTTNALKRNGNVVEALGSALRQGEHALGTVPALVKRVLAEESWREFVTQRGEHIRHDRFVDFVVTPPLAGLGATVELLRRVVADDLEAVDLLDRALQNPVGTHLSRSDSDNITIKDQAGGRGTAREYALRRLRKDAPDLHADVLAGKLSAHAAMVKAGFIAPRFTVQVSSADSIADTLRRRLPPELLAAVAAKLAPE